MLYAKFQDHRTSGSGEDFLKKNYHIWAWQPSWSCDLDHLYKLSIPLPEEAPHEIWHLLAFQRRCLKSNGHTHVYSPRAGADNPLGSNFVH